MKKINFICLFGGGNIAVCDNTGQQVPKLQENVISAVFKKAKELGYELDDNMKILLPCGKAKKLKGYDNYEILK